MINLDVVHSWEGSRLSLKRYLLCNVLGNVALVQVGRRGAGREDPPCNLFLVEASDWMSSLIHFAPAEF